jgi:hypothetical protein
MSNKCNVMTCVALGASFLAAAGCATDGSQPSSDPTVAIARIALSSGNTVSFYEAAPGAIAVDQLVPDNVSSLEVGGMTAVEFYRSIAPGQPVPAALLAAQQRANAGRSARGRSLGMAGQAPGSHPNPQITSVDFANKYCNNDASSWQVINCHADPFPTIGLHGVHDNIDALQTAICVNSGKVRWSMSADGVNQFALDVTEHFCFRRNLDGSADTVTVDTSLESSTANYGLAVKFNH